VSSHALRSRGWASIPAADLIARLVPEYPHLADLLEQPAPIRVPATNPTLLKPALGGTK
jgi:hypothetical protein